MNDVVELILKTYQSMCPLDTERVADSRQKISRYLETLVSAGQHDAEQLTIYGLAAGLAGCVVGRRPMYFCIGLVVGIEVGRMSVIGGA